MRKFLGLLVIIFCSSIITDCTNSKSGNKKEFKKEKLSRMELIEDDNIDRNWFTIWKDKETGTYIFCREKYDSLSCVVIENQKIGIKTNRSFE